MAQQQSVWVGVIAVAALLSAAPVCAQASGTQSSATEPETEEAPREPAAAPNTEKRRAAVLAQLLDPAMYPAAFYSGVQADLIGPTPGVSSLMFGYDAIWMQADLSLGASLGGDPVAGEDADQSYVAGFRLALPVARGIRADYSLLAGGGIIVLDRAGGGTITLVSVAAGARFRVFMTPNVAVAATLGGAALIRDEHSSVAVGARPLGAAAVAYYFR